MKTNATTENPQAAPLRNPPGRPRKADDAVLAPPFAVRLDNDCVAFLDAITTQTGLSRSVAIRALLHGVIDDMRAKKQRLFGIDRNGKRVEIALGSGPGG